MLCLRVVTVASLFFLIYSTALAVTSPFIRDLKLGDKGSDVKALQVFLNKQGFLISSSGVGSPGKETDYFGPSTVKAVRAFQEEYGAKINIAASTGVVGPNTRAFLNSLITKINSVDPIVNSSIKSPVFTRDLKIGDKGSDVKALQVFLNKQGFLIASKGAGSPNKETDYFGPATARALKAFQESKAEVILKPSGFSSGTGYFGPSTRQVVNKINYPETSNSSIKSISNPIFGSGGGGGGGGSSGDSGGGGGSVGDTSAPSIPTSVTFSAIASTSLIVSWATSTDNTAVSYYRIYRDNTLVGTSSVIYYTDTGLVGSSTYSYNVSAVDAAANASATSTTVSTSTNRDVIWWVSTTGSDSNTGHTQATAFATFRKALTSMSGGDVLYINDGTYNDTIGAYQGQFFTEIPSGTAQKYTRIYGYHNHSVTVDGQYTRIPLQIFKSSYVEVSNIVFLHSNGSVVVVDRSDHTYIHNIGAAYSLPSCSNCFAITVGDYTNGTTTGLSHDNLVEDSWAWGYGSRYGLALYNGHDNIMRRNVARYDGSVDNNPKAGVAIYADTNSIAENNIVIDFDKGTDSLLDEHAPFFNTSSQSERAQGSASFYGNMAINTIAALQAGFMIDNGVSRSGTITLSNNVVSSMSSSSVAGIWLSNDSPDTVSGGHHSLVLEHNTIYDSYGSGLRIDNTSWTSVAMNNNLIFNPNSHSTYPCYRNQGATVSGTNNMYYNCDNAFYTALPATNILNSDPQSLYLERIENGTPGKGTASDGGDRGATIINKYVNGTVTGNVLWPFPNEDYIKQDMCNSTDSIASDPSAPGTWTVYTRGHNKTGLCNTSGTLSDYVWKSLGHPNPYGAPDTSAPTVPTSLSITGVTQVVLNLSWATSTDDTAVTAYRVYRNNTFIATTTSANYYDTGLTANTSYTYKVSAVDAANNASAQSSPTSTTTLPDDFSAPSTPTSLVFSSVSTTGLNLTWASSTDNIAVNAYRIYRNSSFIATSTSANYSDSGLNPTATYSYSVSAVDAANNASATSTTVSTSTLADAGPVVVQGASFAFYNSSSSMTLPNNVTSGNWIVFGMYVANNSVANATISDNQGHSGHTTGNFESVMATSTGVFYAIKAVRATATGAYTLNINTNSGNDAAINVVEISGSTATNTLSLINASSTYGAARFATTLNSTSTSPTYTNNLLLSFVANGATTNTFSTTTAGWNLASDIPANATSSQKMFWYKPINVGTTTMNGTISSSGAGFPYAVALNFSIAGSTLPDTSAPSVPSGLAVSSVTTTSESLTWASSTDDYAVTAYRVYKNNVFLATSTNTAYTATGLSPLTSYSFTVSAVDAANNASATSSPVASTTLADTSSPTVPGSLAFSNLTQTTLTLSWASSTDNVAVTAYRVYRNNTFLATSSAITFNDSGLSANTSYSYNVSAVDAANNASATSSTVSTTTLPVDLTSPSVPASLVFTNVSQNTLDVSWASSTDNVGVTAYRLYRGNVFIATTTSANYSDSGLSSNTSYSYNVAAFDAANNFSATSTTYSTTTLAVPIVIVKDTGSIAHNAGSSVSFSFGSLPSQHNNIIVMCSGLDNGGNVTVSDNQGGTTYSSAIHIAETNSGRWTAIRYREDISAPSGTFTITATLSGAGEVNCTGIEVSGLALSSSLDKVATLSSLSHWGDNNATGDSTTTPTLTQGNELVVSVIGGRSNTQFTSVATSSPFTLIYNRMGGNAVYSDSPAGMSYTVANSTSPVTVTWKTTASSANNQNSAGTISIATFKSQ